MEKIQIGQRVHSILYGGRDGTIVAIHGEQEPASIESLGGGAVVMGGNAYFDIAWDDGRESRRIPEAIIRGVQWRIHDDVVSQADVEKALTRVEQQKVRDKEDAEAEQQAIEKERERLLAEFDFLERAEDSKKSPWALAAANIRRELKLGFPNAKFRVKSESYSMGDSVTVYVEEGLSWEKDRHALNFIIGKYQRGYFDSMTDCYMPAKGIGAVFTRLFGGAKYVDASW